MKVKRLLMITGLCFFCACSTPEIEGNNKAETPTVTVAPPPQLSEQEAENAILKNNRERKKNLQSPSSIYSADEIARLIEGITVVSPEEYVPLVCSTEEEKLDVDFILEKIPHNLGEPLLAFTTNGWKIDWSDTSGYKDVNPGEEYPVTLLNDTSYPGIMLLSLAVVNVTTEPVPLEKCAVLAISYITTALENTDASEEGKEARLEIAGLSWGATQEDIVNIFGAPKSVSAVDGSEYVVCTFAYHNHAIIAVLNKERLLNFSIVHSGNL